MADRERLDMALPPGPRLPAALQTLNLLERPFPFMQGCARRFGEPFTLRLLGRGTCVVFNRPDTVREIFSDTERFGRASRLRALLGENSPVVLEGERHRRQRRLLAPFFAGKRMGTYKPVIRAVVDEMTSTWPEGRVFSLMDSIKKIAIDVILRAVFGLRGEVLHEFRRMMVLASESYAGKIGALITLRGLPRKLGLYKLVVPLERAINVRQDLVTREIARRRSEPLEGRDDMLSLMLLARDDEGRPLDDGEIRDILFGMISGGMEAPKAALAWTLHWILAREDVRARIESELAAADEGADPGSAAQFPYLDAVCKEALRVTPLHAMMLRTVNAPCVLGGQRLEPGVKVGASVFLTHHRPDLYPEPERFRPERFLERQYSAYEYYPFGFGERSCLGSALAAYEIRSAVATILRRFRLELPEPRPARGVLRGAHVTPANGVWAVARKR